MVVRWFHVGLRNEGKGIARFPSFRFRRACGFELNEYGIDGNTNFGLPRRAAEPEWIVFQGGIDDVIYPGETKLIGILSQRGAERGVEGSQDRGRFTMTDWQFEGTEFECEIAAEGVALATQGFSVGEGTLPGRRG